MLTPDDLLQITHIVEGVEVRLSDRIGNVKTSLSEVKKDVKDVKRSLDIVAKTLDRDYIRLNERVSRIEQHIGLSAD